MNWVLGYLHPSDTDALRKGLVQDGRIPVVTYAIAPMVAGNMQAKNRPLCLRGTTIERQQNSPFQWYWQIVRQVGLQQEP
ncbi:MAG: hypothetical protein IPH37_15520 [Burkholderiales bacterium]|nr:hypothetical protein [Burkholderiales bacterium]